MVWKEPLSVKTTDVDEYSFITTVQDGNGKDVAHVKVVVNVPAACGTFGAMLIDDPSGGPRQRIRAMILMVRESARHAVALGIRTVHAPHPARLQKFVAIMTNKLSKYDKNTDGVLIASLTDILAHTEAIVSSNGDVPSLTVADVT